MEVWALEGFGVAHILQEILTYKSDHLIARQEILNATIWGKRIPNHEDPPESFRVLVRELRSLALELNHFLVPEISHPPGEFINKKISLIPSSILRYTMRPVI